MRHVILLCMVLLSLSCMKQKSEIQALPNENLQVMQDSHLISFGIKGVMATPAEIKLCKDVGGKIIKSPSLHRDFCQVPYLDAGKVCSDSSECQGTCMTRNINPTYAKNLKINPGTMRGFCQKTNISFGCFMEIKLGEKGHILCID